MEGGLDNLKTGAEWTCKPGFVAGADFRPRRPATISLGDRLPGRSSSLPGSHYGPDKSAGRRATLGRSTVHASCLALLPVGFTKPTWSPRLLVSSYLTVSPLPRGVTLGAVCFLLHFPWPRGRWALPTTVSFVARTFLSSNFTFGQRSPGPLRSITRIGC